MNIITIILFVSAFFGPFQVSAEAVDDAMLYNSTLQFICRYSSDLDHTQGRFVLPKSQDVPTAHLGYYLYRYEPMEQLGRFDITADRFFISHDDMILVQVRCEYYAKLRQQTITHIMAFEPSRSFLSRATRKILDYDPLPNSLKPDIIGHFKELTQKTREWWRYATDRFKEAVFPDHSHVFTVYFLGTKGVLTDAKPNILYKKGETVAGLAKHAQEGDEYVDYLVVDGVGSANRDYYRRFEGFQDDRQPTRARDAFFATTVLDRIAHVMAVLKLESSNPLRRKFVEKLREHRPAINVVNIVGWSRGGAAALVLAKQMAADPRLEHIKVNIFAFDPVAGPSWRSNMFTLSSNVANFEGLYAMHERSLGFEAVVPTRARDNTVTHLTFRAFPGKHNTMVGNTYIAKGDGSNECSLEGISVLAKHFAEQFLVKNGTKLSRITSFDDEQILAIYNQMYQHRACYNRLTKMTYTWQLNADRQLLIGHPDGSFSYQSFRDFFPDYPGFINADHSRLHDHLRGNEDEEDYD